MVGIPFILGSSVLKKAGTTLRSKRIAAEEVKEPVVTKPKGKKAIIHPEAPESSLRTVRFDLSSSSELVKRKSNDEEDDNGPGTRIEEPGSKRQRNAAPVIAELFGAIALKTESMALQERDDPATRFLKLIYKRLYS